MHCDMFGFITLDFILRILCAGMALLSLVISLFRMDLDDFAANLAGFRIPAHMIAHFKFCSHIDHLFVRIHYPS